jgi:hypothetical protein
MEGTAKEREFAIAEPLFQYRIAAECVVPNIRRDGRPEGVIVEINVEAGTP